MNTKKVEEVLKIIGKDENLRNKFIRFVKEIEDNLPYKGSIRDDLTKYLVDALFEKNDFIIKTTQNGIKFKFLTGLGSKVPREFLMSSPETPEFAWEPQTTKLLLFLSENAKNVIVGGAYFGEQVLPIAKKIKKHSGIVHAFDLNKQQIATLKENLALNNIENVRPVYKGLWKDSETFLNLTETDDLAFATPALNAGLSNTITIDDYIENNGLEGVDLIMLDIEGSELNVLKGAENQLKKVVDFPNIVFEIHSSYVDWSSGLLNTPIARYLNSFKYHLYSIRDFQGNYDMKGKAIELIKPEETVLAGPPHGFNMLAIKDSSLIENSLFKICSNVSPKYILHKDPLLHHHSEGFK